MLWIPFITYNFNITCLKLKTELPPTTFLHEEIFLRKNLNLVHFIPTKTSIFQKDVKETGTNLPVICFLQKIPPLIKKCKLHLVKFSRRTLHLLILSIILLKSDDEGDWYIDDNHHLY